MSHSTPPNRVRLALSSGEIFTGWGFGASNQSGGEVVFNTAMSGYEESISDPSYMGQILIQTAPMIGNTGMNQRDMESNALQIKGLVVHEYVESHSNYRSTSSLNHWLEHAGIPGIYGVDTRAITTILRSQGVVQGVISADQTLSDPDLIGRARSLQSMAGTVFASTGQSPDSNQRSISSDQWTHLDSQGGDPVPIGLIDCGVKESILRCLTDVGCNPILLPMTTNSAQIKEMLLDGTIYGLFLSNGPGDPSAMTDLVSTVSTLIDDPKLSNYPIFGICLGHQILALAQGATTYKLKFGHRGVNHPIVECSTGCVSISSQNHGFAVDADSCLDSGLQVTHLHLNDDTIAGIQARNGIIAGMQFHPEASPGPHDTNGFFDRFETAVRKVFGEANC